MLRIYGVNGNLLRAVKSMYEGAKVAVRVEDELSVFFELKVGLKQGCICMAGYREMLCPLLYLYILLHWEQ